MTDLFLVPIEKEPNVGNECFGLLKIPPAFARLMVDRANDLEALRVKALSTGDPPCSCLTYVDTVLLIFELMDETEEDIDLYIHKQIQAARESADKVLAVPDDFDPLLHAEPIESMADRTYVRRLGISFTVEQDTSLVVFTTPGLPHTLFRGLAGLDEDATTADPLATMARLQAMLRSPTQEEDREKASER